MTGILSAQNLLRDAFTRVRDVVADLTDTLADEVATYRPDPEANSVAWLVWHLSRVQDDHVAELAGVDQVWAAWRHRFDLPFAPDATGYGHSAAAVGQVRVGGKLLGGYHADVHAMTLRYLDLLSEVELGRVVDPRWDPPVTAAVRLVSVIDDAAQHAGQAFYVRGLAERRARAWQQPGAADR
jgi:hypothetical protein